MGFENSSTYQWIFLQAGLGKSYTVTIRKVRRPHLCKFAFISLDIRSQLELMYGWLVLVCYIRRYLIADAEQLVCWWIGEWRKQMSWKLNALSIQLPWQSKFIKLLTSWLLMKPTSIQQSTIQVKSGKNQKENTHGVHSKSFNLSIFSSIGWWVFENKYVETNRGGNIEKEKSIHGRIEVWRK